MKTNLLISTKMTLLVMFFLLPVMEFTGFGAWAQSVVITTTNNKCLNGGIVNVGSTTGLGATPEFQVLKNGVLVLPDPGNSGLFSTATSFTGLVDGNYVVVGRAGPSNPTYSSNSIAVDDGYVNFVASTSIVSASCVGGTAVLTTNVTSGGVKPLTFSIASASSPGVPLQTASGINANSFSYNALPVGNYTVSVTDSCGQTIVGATSVSAVSTTLADVKLPSSIFTRANLTCSNPFIIRNELGFTYVAGGAPLTGAAAALFSVHILYNGVLYGKDNTGDGYADAGAPGWAANSATSLQMPLGITRANILANLGNIKVVLMDACGNTKEFTVTRPLYNIGMSNCGGVAYATSTIYSGLVCLPMNITFTNTSNPSDVVAFTQTTGTQTFTGGLTPGQTYSYTYLDSEGYSTGIFSLPQTKTIPTSGSTSVTQNFYGNQFNLNVLNYGRLLINYSPFVVGDIIYYTVTASNNPLVPVGHTGSVALDPNGNAYLPRVNATDPAGYWPEGNYTITVNGNCGSSSANFVVSGYTASSFDNLITPVCGGFNYQLTGVFDNYNAYQVVVISGPSSVGQVRDLSNATTSQPFNGLTSGNYVFGVRIKGGTSFIHTRIVSITADYFITVDKPVTGGYVCNSGDTNGVLSITASSIAPAPGNVLEYALSPDGGTTYGPYQSGSTFSGLSGGIYYFRVKDACGNIITQTARLGVESNPQIAVNGVYGNASVCNYTGATVTLTLDVDLPGLTYLWSGPGINATNNNVKNPVVNVSDMSSGTNVYTCILNSGPPCNTNGTATVTIDSKPFVDLVVTYPAPVCFPSTVDLTAPAVTASSTGVFSKTYWKDAACTIPLTPANAVSISGTYYIRGRADASLNLCETIRPVVVVINPLPVATISYPGGPFCPTGTAAVSVSGSSGGTFTSDAGLSINASTGVINLAASTSGNHTVTYNFTNAGCSSTTTTVVNVKNPIQCAVVTVIDAVNDNTYPVQTPSTTVATTVGNVTLNDTLNGVPVAASNTDVTPITTGPLSIDADGVLTLAPNTTSGTYTITYQLCEAGTTPANSNCDTATATVVVGKPIDAVNDNTYPVQTPSTTVATTVGNVTLNDTLNGVPVTASNTDVTPITTGPLSIDADGVLTLAPNTTSGTYTITYQLCEAGTTPANSNCDTATATVVVGKPIDAVNDNTYPVQTPSTTVATTVGNVTLNDTLNGVPVTASNTDVTPITTGPLSIDADGVLTLAPNTTSGTYTITYQLCEAGTTPANSNCDTATAVVVVPRIHITKDGVYSDANGDGFTSVGDVINYNFVVTNSGSAVLTNITVTDNNAVVTGGPLATLAIGASNSTMFTAVHTITAADIAAGYVYNLATATGTDTNGNPVTDTSSDPIPDPNPCVGCVVDPVCPDCTIVELTNTTFAINDINDTYRNTPVSGNVLTNDFDVEGHTQTVTPSNTTTAEGTLVLNADGTYTFTPATGFEGTFVHSYTVCDNGIPQSCDTAIVTINVEQNPTDTNNSVVANNDAVITEVGTPITISVLSNDFDPNGNPFTITPDSVTIPVNGTVTVNPDGTITYTPNPLFVGEDTFTYQICDNQIPQACDTATVIVTVLPLSNLNTTYAMDDSYFINCSSNSTMNLLDNDYDLESNTQTINTIPVVQPLHGTVIINSDGTFNYTVSGCYAGPDSFIYQVCDNGTQQKCDVATVYLLISANQSPVVTGTITPATAEGCSATAAPTAVTTVVALEGMGLTIADDCTPDATLVVTSADTSAGTCPIVVTRTYTITDACGNFTTATQTINVQDTTAPVVTGTITSSTIQGCSATAAPAAVTTVTALEAMGLTIADACTLDATLVVTSADTSAGTCPIVVTRTYTITDACGNFTTATQTINVQDTTAPVVTGTITSSTIQGCSATAAPTAVTTVTALETMGLTIADACTSDATLVVTSADTSAGTCPIVVTRTYTITDACGNFTTATQTINVQDTTAPVVTGTITSSTIQGCSATAAPAAVTTVTALEAMGLTIADACTPDATLVVTSADTSAGTCPIVVTRTYRITDACGNFTTATQTINVQDTTAPVVTGTITSSTIQGCSATAAPTAVTTVTALETMGLTIADACTSDATLVVTSADTSAGTCPIVVTRTYTITDACGNFTTAKQTINVQDTTAPVVTGTISVANVQGCLATAAPAAVTTVAALEGMGLTIADACTSDATLVVTSTDTSVGTCPIVVTRTYTITDTCGNFTTATQTINVQDTTAPVVTGTIPVATAQGCSASAAPSPVSTVVALEVLFGISVSDACTSDATLVVTSTDTSAGTCPIVVTRTYRITDACGNFTTAKQTINVQDTTAPVVTGTISVANVQGCLATAAPAAVTTVAALEGMGLTIADACTSDATLVVTSADTSAGTCPIVVTRTYTITDACGNFTTATQTINVQDTTVPVVTGTIPVTNVQGCSATAAPAAVTTVAALEGMGLTIADACTLDATLVVTSTDTSVGTCPIVVTRTYRITDACGNFTTATQTINIQDTTAPVVTGTIPVANVQGCSASAAPSPVSTVVALEVLFGISVSDACTSDATLVVTSADTSAGTCPIVVTRTYTITDACGNFTTATQTINVQDTTAPVVTGTIAPATAEGCSATAAPTAVTTVTALETMGLTIADACTSDATLVVTSTDVSAGKCPIVVTRTYTITDACGNFTTATQTINVQDTTVPVVTGTIPVTNVQGCSATAAPAAVTTVTALEAMGLTIADACTPDATLVVTSADTSAGTCPIVVTRTYTITDACGNFTTATQTINIQDTTVPVVTGIIPVANVQGCSASAAPSPVSTVVALEVLFGISVSDACTSDATLVVTSADTSAGTCPIVVTRTYTITDACGNFTTATQTINVQDTTAPVVTGTIAPATAEGCSATAAPTAVTTVTALETMGLTIADACTSDATLVVTSTDASAGTCPIVVTRTYTITDACGNFTTATQTINVQDTTAPVVTGTIAPATTEGCSATAAPAAVTTVTALEAMGLTIADACTPDATLVVTSADTSAGTCPIVVTRTYRIADACGNFTTATQTINIQDTTVPVVTGIIPVTNVQGCSATAAPSPVSTVVALEVLFGISVSDACTSDATLVVTSADTSAGTCPIVVTRTYTITDACGNFTTATQTINVQDTTAPVVTGTIAPATAEGCSASDAPAAVTTVTALETMGLTIADACTSDATLVVTSTDASAGTCPIVVTRTYTITDACGNFTTATQTINVQDTTAPVVTGTIAQATAEGCSATAAPAAVTTVTALEAMGLTIADICTPDATLVVTSADTSAGTCPIVVTRTYTITDACGNFTTATQIIDIQDTTVPVFLGNLPSDLVLECSDVIPTVPTLIAADNCAGIPTVTFVEVNTQGSCPNAFTLTRTWTATDVCGNQTIHTQTIDVEDTTAPVFVGNLPETVIFANCDAIPEAATLTATDNCGSATVVYGDPVEVEGDCTNRKSIIRTWTATDECGNTSTFTQTVYLACYVTVYNAVSPNGDGINDEFIIEGLECYPNNTVEVYNRWGVKVYETSGYDNINKAFKGYSDGRSTISPDQLLPTGTYFYILKYEYDLYGKNQQNIEKSGYLYLQSN